MLNFFFVRKHKNRVLLYIDRVFKGVNPDIQYALSIDEYENFKEQKEVHGYLHLRCGEARNAVDEIPCKALCLPL